ncbi:MAG: hypothetical protein JJD92_12715 [Frankiaceae bacterium]|nr:hypothetical protein [Frankiaceae bacterium]
MTTMVPPGQVSAFIVVGMRPSVSTNTQKLDRGMRSSHVLGGEVEVDPTGPSLLTEQVHGRQERTEGEHERDHHTHL